MWHLASRAKSMVSGDRRNFRIALPCVPASGCYHSSHLMEFETMPRPRVEHTRSHASEVAELLKRERPDLDPSDYLYLVYVQRVGRILETVDDRHCRTEFGISASDMRVLFALRRAGPDYALRPTRIVPLAPSHLRRDHKAGRSAGGVRLRPPFARPPEERRISDPAEHEGKADRRPGDDLPRQFLGRFHPSAHAQGTGHALRRPRKGAARPGGAPPQPSQARPAPSHSGRRSNGNAREA